MSSPREDSDDGGLAQTLAFPQFVRDEGTMPLFGGYMKNTESKKKIRIHSQSKIERNLAPRGQSNDRALSSSQGFAIGSASGFAIGSVSGFAIG